MCVWGEWGGIILATPGRSYSFLQGCPGEPHRDLTSAMWMLGKGIPGSRISLCKGPGVDPLFLRGTSSSLLPRNHRAGSWCCPRCLCNLLEEQKGLRPLIRHWSLGTVSIAHGSSKGRSAWAPVRSCPCSVRLRCHWRREARASELSPWGARPASGW